MPLEVARARYHDRAGHRDAGHLDDARTDTELGGEPSCGPGLGPVVDVDTTTPVDVARLAAALNQVFSAG